MAPEALFVYGSLTFDDVLAALLKRTPRLTPVVATGWRAIALPERPYPGLREADDEKTHGFLIDDLTADEWQVIDAFEDPVYDLRVIPTDGPLPAWSYTCPATSEAGTEPDWDRDEFATRHLASYVAMCREWRRST